MRQPMKRRCSCVLTIKYTFTRIYWWTRQSIHNTLIVVDRYLWLMGDKTIPDSTEPRLESFYPPFVACIDLPDQGVVDSYSPPLVVCIDLPHQGVVDSYSPPLVACIDLPHQGVVDSYSPPLVAGIDLPHQGVVDSYNPPIVASIDLSTTSKCSGFW